MRFLHTSDWHLGRQFHNVSLLEDQRHLLRQIIDLARQHRVDLLLVAGDIYDRSVPPAAAVSLLNEVIETLADAGIKLLLIAGNHDGPERLGFGAELLARQGVYIRGPLDPQLAPIMLEDEAGPVAVYALPYAEPARVRELLGIEVHSHQEAMAALTERILAQPEARHRTLLVAHCFVAGAEGCESERPLSVGGAEQVDPRLFEPFDYVALGHLHSPQWRLAAHIRYSGSLYKYSFKEEAQTKGVLLVEMDAEGSCQTEMLPLQPLRDLRSIEGELEELLRAAGEDPGREDYLLVRLRDRRAILDVMGKLREVYPNVLHLERVGLMASESVRVGGREQLSRGGIHLFADFYQQMTSDELEAGQRELIEGLFAQLQHQDREAE